MITFSAFGSFLICLALLLCCAALFIKGERLVARLTQSVSLILSLALLALIDAFLTRNETLELSALHTHAHEPALYRFVGFLGTYEGSLLFFTLLVSLYATLFSVTSRFPLAATVLRIQNLTLASLLIFLTVVARPFRGITKQALSEQVIRGFNPLLEDPSMSFHPPLLYFGITGLSIVYAITLASLWHKASFESWAKCIKPWLLLVWGLLTLGVGTGAWWAYYQLGWGGYWSWDPTENTSIMPWLVACALVHIIPLALRAKRYENLALFLALSCFPLVLFGTFLVRSGLLISVHAFGSAQAQHARQFLLIAYAHTITALVSHIWYLWQQNETQEKKSSLAPLEYRLYFLLASVIFTLLGCASVAAGTVYPMLFPKTSIDTPFYVATFIPLALACAFLLPLALCASRFDRLYQIGIVSLLAGLYPLFFGPPLMNLVPVALSLAVWVILSSARDVVLKVSHPLRVWARSLAHVGFGVVILGAAIMAGWKKEAWIPVNPGQSFCFHGERYHLKAVKENETGEYKRLTAVIRTDSGKEFQPQLRHFLSSKQTISQSYISTTGLSQTYIALSVTDQADALVCRMYYNPCVLLLWVGTGLIAAGSFMALWTRKHHA